MINNTVESDPEISNIYIGRNKVFTALRINRGVVYELTQANIKDLPELLNRWLDLPLHAAILTSPEPRSIFIKMADIAQLMSEQGDNRERVLKSAGFPDRLAKNLLGDLKSPGKRGSVVVTDLNSDNYVSRNTEETGAGFLFLGGKDVNWIFNYDKADEQTEAQVVIAKESTATEIISELIRDFL